MARRGEFVNRLAVSPDGASEALGVPLRRVYTLLAAGELPSYRDGKRRLIPVAALTQYVERKVAAASASAGPRGAL